MQSKELNTDYSRMKRRNLIWLCVWIVVALIGAGLSAFDGSWAVFLLFLVIAVLGGAATLKFRRAADGHIPDVWLFGSGRDSNGSDGSSNGFD